MEEPTERGQPEPTTAPAPQEATPEPTPQVPEKFAGKSVSEVAQAYSELEKTFGKQTEEIGNLRNEMAYMRGMVEQGIQRGQPQEPTPPPETKFGVDPEQFFARPVENVDMIVAKRLQEYETRRQKDEKARDEAEAKANYFEGREAAHRQNKRIFEGIEQAVDNLVYESHRMGAVTKASLRNPKTWERAAQLVWLEKGDVSKLAPPATKPVSASPTESPQAGKPYSFEETPIEVDDETRRFWKEQGLSEKDGMEITRKELEAVMTRRNLSRRY